LISGTYTNTSTNTTPCDCYFATIATSNVNSTSITLALSGPSSGCGLNTNTSNFTDGIATTYTLTFDALGISRGTITGNLNTTSNSTVPLSLSFDILYDGTIVYY